ncbi:MAG: Spy/CpxP family protein refolding chaperone [Chthoniobacteraceae bacterium]
MKTVFATITPILVCAVAMIAAVPSASAKDGAQARGGHRLEKIFGDTPLSPEQKEKVRAVLKAHRPEIRAAREKAEAAHLALTEASKGSDAAAINHAADQVGEAARDRALLRARIASEIRPLLTPEQVKSLDTFRAEFRQRARAAAGAFGSNS